MARKFVVSSRLTTEDDSSKVVERNIGVWSKFGGFLKDRFVFTLSDVSRALDAVGESIRRNLDLRNATRALRAQLAEANVSLESFIATLQDVSKGTVATADLIQSSSRALLLGIPAEDISKLLEIAAASAQATGQSVAQAFNDIATGVGRASPLILDNLGLVIRLEDAYADYAAELGKSTDALTNTERKQAILNATLESGQRIIEQIGIATDEQVRSLQQLAAAQRNLADSTDSAVASFSSGVLEAGRLNDTLRRLNDSAEETGGFFRFLGEETLGRDLNRINLLVRAYDFLADAITGIIKPAKAAEAATDDLNESTFDAKKAAEEFSAALLKEVEAIDKVVKKEREAVKFRKEFFEELGIEEIDTLNEKLEEQAIKLEVINEAYRLGTITPAAYAAAQREITIEMEATQAAIDGTVASVDEYKDSLRETNFVQTEFGDVVDSSTQRLDLNTRALLENQNAQDRLNQSKRDDPDRDPLIQDRNTIGGGTFTVVRPRDQGPRIGSPLGGWVVPTRNELFSG